MKLKAITTAVAAAAIGVGLSACGGSTAAGVTTAPSQGRTAPTTAAKTPTTSSSSKVKTPTSGPLSKEPSFKVPTGPAPTKLKVVTLVKGTGPVAKKGDQLYVNYVGKLYSTGKTFQATWSTGTPFGPFELGVGDVIPGWDQGLVGLRQGGRYELIIPPSLAYKNSKDQKGIPPGSTLVFVVDILKVSK